MNIHVLNPKTTWGILLGIVKELNKVDSVVTTIEWPVVNLLVRFDEEQELDMFICNLDADKQAEREHKNNRERQKEKRQQQCPVSQVNIGYIRVIVCD